MHRSTDEIRALFVDSCGGVVKQRPSHRGGSDYTTTKYQSIKFADNIHIGISRGDYTEEQLAPYKSEDGEEFDRERFYADKVDPHIITELHVLDDAGEWAGPSVSIYKPQVDWKFAAGDDTKFVVKPAYCSSSSCSMETTEHARCQAEMILLAAEYADAWTAEARPALQAECDEQMAKWAADREERKAAHEAKVARVDRILDAAQRRPVRVRIEGRKSPFRGQLVRLSETTFGVERDDEIRKIDVDKLSSIEVTRRGSSSYQTIDHR